MNDVVFNNVSKSYGKKTVLENFSCRFERGKISCIMGESGCGKTTLLNLILGVVPPDGGEVCGVPDDVSAVFQEDRLCDSFSAVANVLAVTGKSVPVAEVVECLSDLGLSESLKKPVSELSGGMRRRVAIARALLAPCELLILDEPFQGLDRITREKTVAVILSRTSGKTVIMATHDERDSELLNASVLHM